MAFANASFTGIFQTRRFHLSIGHGGNITCLLDIIPQVQAPPAIGNLTVTDGFIHLTLIGCRIDRASITYNSRGQIVRAIVLGPTWKWKLAGIDGIYNVPRPDGTIDPDTEKTPRELATLLFEAMRVPRFDVSGMPNATRPFVNWHGDFAYSELTQLCHDLGCDFGYDVHNQIARIWTVGQGSNLPLGGEQTITYGADFSESPDVIKAYSNFSEFQSKLATECVMPDLDGTWKLADEVSYAPEDGWAGSNPFDPLPDSDDKVARGLARRWLWRAYRAKSQADGSNKVPVYGEVDGMEDILPLHDRLLESYELGGMYNQVAYAEGTFAIGGDPDPVYNTEPFERIEIGHRLDGERGIMIFDAPIYQLGDDDYGYDVNDAAKEAEVYIVCSYHVRDKDTRQYIAHTHERRVANNGTGDYPLHRPDLVRRIIATYDGKTVDETKDNLEELKRLLDESIDALAAEFQSSESVVKRYRGLVPVVVDGAIRQVTYYGNCEGSNRGVFTVAARNTEWEEGVVRRLGRMRTASNDAMRIMKEQLRYERRKRRRRGQE